MSNNHLESEINDRHDHIVSSTEGSLWLVPHLGKDYFLQQIQDKLSYYESGSGGYGEVLAQIAVRTKVDFDKLVDPKIDLNELFSDYFKSIGLG